jgi:hypothetical protein
MVCFILILNFNIDGLFTVDRVPLYQMQNMADETKRRFPVSGKSFILKEKCKK